jgi:hypothetical protein
MSPAGSRLVPRTCLVASLLAFGAYGCATLFGMDDASCSDCIGERVLSEEPGASGLEPAGGGSGGAAPGMATGDAEDGTNPVGLEPGRTPPNPVGSEQGDPVQGDPVQAAPLQPDAGPDSGAQPEPDSCARYCDAIMNTCLPGTGGVPDNLAYVDRDACLKLCPYFPRASAGEPAGKNTLECRLGLLDSAEANEPSTVCQAAGRGGQAGANPVCGSNCDAYCSLMQQICPAEFSRLTPSCESVCAGLSDELAFDVTRDELSGNTVQCRLWHVGLAASCDPARVASCLPLHCGHSSGQGGLGHEHAERRQDEPTARRRACAGASRP